MNDTWIALNRDQVRLVVTTVGASRGIGVNQLHVTLELTTRSAALADAHIWLGGSVRLSDLGAGGGYLTTLRADIQPATIVAPGGHQTVSIVADFDDRQLQIIEGWRTSGLTFQFGFSGNVVGPEGTIPFWSANVDYAIDQSAWIVLVEQLGYRKLMLLELEAPQTAGKQPIHVTEALRYFEEAQNNFLTHEWRLTVESLRQSLAAVVGLKPDDEQTQTEVAADQKDARKLITTKPPTYDDRFELVRSALKFVCDLAAHPTPDTETTRREAHAALLSVAGVLSRLVS